MVTITQPTAALPVHSVQAAQVYYRDRFGFEVKWYHEGGRIGAVSHGEAAVFLREVEGDIQPNELWIFCADVDGVHADLAARGADISEQLRDTTWGLRQFTATDLAGHQLHFFCDL